MKKYDIVSIDNICKINKNSSFSYKKHIYGDTKEQLINKITTAIGIACDKYEKGEIPKGSAYEENKALVTIIVEFLGIK